MRQANENTKEWMDRIRVAAIDCNYKELDKHLLDQFIHKLNDSGMLAEIIRELTKTNENILVTSEQIANRIESQRAQTADINSLNEVKDFDAIMTTKRKQNGMKLNRS